MNKSMKPTAPRQMTEEERKEQMTRAFLQKRASLAEGILFNLCQGKNITATTTNIECIQMVDAAISMADKMLEKLYGGNVEEK